MESNKKNFKTSLFGGYAKGEVNNFVEEISRKFTESQEQILELKKELQLAKHRVEHLEDIENKLVTALNDASNLSEKSLQQADLSASLKIQEAETKADKILFEAKEKRVKIIQAAKEFYKQKMEEVRSEASNVKRHVDLIDEQTERLSQEMYQIALRAKQEINRLQSFKVKTTDDSAPAKKTSPAPKQTPAENNKKQSAGDYVEVSKSFFNEVK